MADIELTTVPAETTVDAGDEIYFNDVSETPDALNRITIDNLFSNALPPYLPCELVIACSDETTSITTGTAKVSFRMPFAMTLNAGNAGVRAQAGTAPTGSTLIIDINEGDSPATILSTKLSIDAGEKTSLSAASAAVISDTALADDALITIDFDQVGATIPGAGIKVTLRGVRA